MATTTATIIPSASSLKIDSKRLSTTLQNTCDTFGMDFRYGAAQHETGMFRLALSDSDKGVRDWLVDEVMQLGCTVKVDQMGNMFCIRSGKIDGPPIAIGSHLDTQPMGGRYDGILGVQSGLEILRTLHDNNYETTHPICLINWTNEEGARWVRCLLSNNLTAFRFPKSLHGSSVYANIATLEEAHSLKAVIGKPVTALSELKRIGYLGNTECCYKSNPLKAYFEYHIEQGQVLEESATQKVGVVSQGNPYRWFTLKVKGKESHTGATPFHKRADSVLAGASMVVAGTQLAKKMGGLFSTGIFGAEPGSVNTTAGYVEISVDIRHESNEQLDELEKEVMKVSVNVAKESNCEFEWLKSDRSDTKYFNDEAVASISRGAELTVGENGYKRMRTLAGHDCCAVSSTGIPAAMIFCPSRDGVTHNPREYTSADECALGCQVLLQAVLDYDSKTA